MFICHLDFGGSILIQGFSETEKVCQGTNAGGRAQHQLSYLSIQGNSMVNSFLRNACPYMDQMYSRRNEKKTNSSRK